MLEAARGVLGELGEGGRSADVGRRVDEVAAAVRPRSDDVGALRLLDDLGRARAAEDEALDGNVLVLRLPDAGVVGTERHAVDDGARLFGRGQPVLAQDPGDGLAADLSRAPGDRGGRRAQAVGIPVRTHAADGDPVGFELVSRVQEGDSAALALELPVLDQVLDPPVDQAVELLAGRLELDRLRDGEGQDVRGNLRRRCFDDVDLHGRARMLSEQVRTVFLE